MQPSHTLNRHILRGFAFGHNVAYCNGKNLLKAQIKNLPKQKDSACVLILKDINLVNFFFIFSQTMKYIKTATLHTTQVKTTF